MPTNFPLLFRSAALSLVLAALSLSRHQLGVHSFQVPTAPTTTTRSVTAPQGASTSTCLHLAKSRSTRRKNLRKAEKSRPQQFRDAINDAKGEPKQPEGEASVAAAASAVATKEGPPATGGDDAEAADAARRAGLADEAQRRMDERPEVSTMIVDEETGIEIVAQGKSVMDVITRKAVKLSDLGPEYRMAQMFPGVPPDVREKDRFDDWTTIQVPEMVDRLRDACMVKMKGADREIPPHPSVANKAIDFVLANRDRLGYKMKRTLGRLQMNSLSEGNKEEAAGYQKLWKNFLTLENHISAPFRQMIMDGEGRVGPNFGNLDVKSYCDGEPYERCANYLVLKAMVAHWEKKVVDADYLEKTPQTKENYMTILARGDPKRYLPDPPILFTLRECTQVCLMAQQMAKAFVEDPELFGDLPPEVRFLEAALSIQGGAPLRKFVIDEFCPAEGIAPDALREGLRRVLVQFENMQLDPYGDLANLIERLCVAVSLGTDDERDPYALYLANKDKNGPGAFQTYTFNAEKLSRVRFLDAQYERAGAPAADKPQSGGFFDFGAAVASKPQQSATTKASSEETYKVPQARAAGRPHELGWLELLGDEKKDDDVDLRLGKVPPGQILVEE